jgi:hypothetical protein
MMKQNGWILLLIIFSAMCFGFETVARVTAMNTMNVGYIAGVLSFLAAIFLGVRNR